ncbi:hypothetical protein RB601_002431 [Gaeumannomyces tritici]
MDRLRDLLRRRYKYGALPTSWDDEDELERTTSDPAVKRAPQTHKSRRKFGIALTGACIMIALITAVAFFGFGYGAAAGDSSCDSPTLGFQCHTDIAQSWGQYSPFFTVPSEMDAGLPAGCEITFAQVLSRHGARDPTGGKSRAYNDTVTRIQRDVGQYGDGFGFVKDYRYALGADQLTEFGRGQMRNSGVRFYERYRALARDATPFIRASGQDRVVESGDKWAEGFHQARVADGVRAEDDGFPYPKVVIPETEGSNNTLDHGLCTAFERSKGGAKVQAEFLASFGGPIRDRLNKGMPGANITLDEVVQLMELCPFESVARTDGRLSEFCGLFSREEWRSYDYLMTLGKYYSYGPGSPLGPTQGVGFTNELLARLTGAAVSDRTSTNRTLDSGPATFPLGRALYADFSHDNDMTGVYGALGLYNATAAAPPPASGRREPADLAGYSASWTVPFSARMYVEKMRCGGGGGGGAELVRILVNDRVIPLQNCGADELGRCELGRFVESLSFARGGGHWDKCFV